MRTRSTVVAVLAAGLVACSADVRVELTVIEADTTTTTEGLPAEASRATVVVMSDGLEISVPDGGETVSIFETIADPRTYSVRLLYPASDLERVRSHYVSIAGDGPPWVVESDDRVDTISLDRRPDGFVLEIEVLATG